MSKVNTCGEWTATLYSEEEGRNRLKVHGQCTFPTPGFKVHLRRKDPQGINPKVLLLDKTVIAPTGIEPEHVVTIPVSFEEHTNVHYDEVEVFPDGTRIHVKEARVVETQRSASGR